MTITSKNTDAYLITGYIAYPGSLYTYGETTGLNVISDIYTQDLNPFFPTSYATFNVSWVYIFNAGENLINTNRLIRALPAYNLGVYDVTYNGITTDSKFLNYISQRSPVYSSWILNTLKSYPQPFIPPAFKVGEYTTLNNSGSDLIKPVSTRYGDTIYVKIYGCDTASLQSWVYYNASVRYDIEADDVIYADM